MVVFSWSPNLRWVRVDFILLKFTSGWTLSMVSKWVVGPPICRLKIISKLLLVIMFIAMTIHCEYPTFAMRSLLWHETHLPQNLEVGPIGLMQHFVMFSWNIKIILLLNVNPISKWKQPSSMIVLADQPPGSPANHWMSTSWTDSSNLASTMSEICLIYDQNFLPTYYCGGRK